MARSGGSEPRGARRQALFGIAKAALLKREKCEEPSPKQPESPVEGKTIRREKKDPIAVRGNTQPSARRRRIARGGQATSGRSVTPRKSPAAAASKAHLQ
jgi:hypothetical protein